jgi:haloalkane dehalogenase
MKDFVFDRHFLEEWGRRMPHARVKRFEDCGHYILEDAAGEIVPLVNEFLR